MATALMPYKYLKVIHIAIHKPTMHNVLIYLYMYLVLHEADISSIEVVGVMLVPMFPSSTASAWRSFRAASVGK